MKDTGELQHEYLTKLLHCNKRMTVNQAIHRMNVLNQYIARNYLARKEYLR